MILKLPDMSDMLGVADYIQLVGAMAKGKDGLARCNR